MPSNSTAPMADTERAIAQQRYLDARAKGFWIYQAASAAGVDRRTITNWRANNPDFAEAEKVATSDGDESRNEMVESRLFSQTKTNVIAAQVWLYNRRSDRWADRRQQELNVKTTDSTIKVILGTTVRPDGDTEESGKAS